MYFSISAFDVPRTESTTTTKLLITEAPHLLFPNLKSKEVLMITRGLTNTEAPCLLFLNRKSKEVLMVIHGLSITEATRLVFLNRKI